MIIFKVDMIKRQHYSPKIILFFLYFKVTPDVEVIPTTESLAKLWGLLKDNLTTRHNNTFTDEQNDQSTNGQNEKSTNWQNNSLITEAEDTTQTDDLISEEISSSKSILILTVLFSNYIVTANLNRDAF
jgi:hypothetical protein